MIKTEIPNYKINQICRDCYIVSKEISKICKKCHSPRTLSHKEISKLYIAHIDCDAFYASVEKRDNPTLKNKPVIIGGGSRGVVSTACYIARTKGVKSAMPMFKAKELCPEAVVIAPNIKKYKNVSLEIREMMKKLTPVIEPISLDEAFLDLKGTYRLHKKVPALILVELVKDIKVKIGINVSVGLSFNKYLAKVCSDLDKPKGFSIIGKSEAISFLKDKPVNLLWGVGSKFKKRLNSEGIINIGQIQKMQDKELVKRYGAIGYHIYQLSRGEDNRKIESNRKIKSISHETTFQKDTNNKKELEKVLNNLSRKVSDRSKLLGVGGKTINLKLKTKDFKIITRSITFSDATQLHTRIFKNAKELLHDNINNSKYRLIGVGISELIEEKLCDLDSLIDIKSNNDKKIEVALSKLRNKFGDNIIVKGNNNEYN